MCLLRRHWQPTTDSKSIFMQPSKPDESSMSQQFNDFSALADAFTALMSLKPIACTRTYHLQRRSTEIPWLEYCVGGPAKEAISEYFLLRSESAFVQAKALLEERCGNRFTVTEAFRDKLWACPPRSQGEMEIASDGLQTSLISANREILNDNRENHKLLKKLPDWVVNRWSRIASTSRKADGVYPSFKQFAEFINEEASLWSSYIVRIIERTSRARTQRQADICNSKSEEKKPCNNDTVIRYSRQQVSCAKETTTTDPNVEPLEQNLS